MKFIRPTTHITIYIIYDILKASMLGNTAPIVDNVPHSFAIVPIDILK